MNQLAILAFEINLKLIRTDLSTKSGFFSAAKPPTTEQLYEGIQKLWDPVDTFISPKIGETSDNVKRYVYGASMIYLKIEDGSYLGNSFLGHSFFFPDCLSEVRVFPTAQNHDPFLDTQIINLLKEQEEAEEFEVGICYLTDMEQTNADNLFKETFLKFNKSQKGKLHLITIGENHTLHFSAADFSTEKMQGSLAGVPRWRIPTEELDQSAVATFLRSLTINSKGDPFEQHVNEMLLTGLPDRNASSVPPTTGDTSQSNISVFEKSDRWSVYTLDFDQYPDGVSILLDIGDDFYSEIWEKVYYLTTDEGTWYEAYANPAIRDIWGNFTLEGEFSEFKEELTSYWEFDPSLFGEYGQITFFVPDDEETHTLDRLTEFFH